MSCHVASWLRSGRILVATVSLVLAAPLAAQSLSAPGLTQPGKISWDAEGVPTIQAANDNDAAFLQGYAHARDRFFQMDLTRRSVSGTLAELVGPSQLDDDVQARTLGLRRAAVKSWMAMSSDSRGWLKSYADGVNYWLETNALPPEYGALDLTHADPWTPVDSLCVGKGLAFQLSFDLDIDATIAVGAYQQAGAAAGIDGAALYFGDTHRAAPPDDRVTVPGFQPGAASGANAPKTTATALPGAHAAAGIGSIDPAAIDLARAYREKVKDNPLFKSALEGRESPIGSNEWAIAGQHTVSGKPILSNDPHLGLSLPPVFTEQHVLSRDSRYADALDVTGVTVPGTPGVIQGCNQRLCWGTTTNSLDVTDVFQETLRVNSYGLPYAIVHNGKEEPVQWVFQSYYVNQLDGTPDNIARDNSIGYTNGALSIIVPRRNDGPIVQTMGTTGLSIAYAGWGPTGEIESFRRINRARNLDDFRDALTYFDFGSQNFAYADVDGNIAYFTSGEAPIRTDLQTQGAPGGGIPPWLIRDGSGALKHDWLPVQHPQPNQALPFEILRVDEMPFVINPERGYFANANNDAIGYSLDNNPLNQLRSDGGIYYLSSGGDSAYRMGRIDREIQSLIASGRKISVDDMKELQANGQILDAELVLPHLLAAYDNALAAGAWAPLAQFAADPRVTEAIARLRSWDYSTPTGIQPGYDPGDNPQSLPVPSQTERDASVAATIWAMWRSQALANIVDFPLSSIGLGSYLPGGGDAYAGMKFMLDNFDQLQGHGVSGLDFVNLANRGASLGVPDGAAPPPTRAAARDYLVLGSLYQGLSMLATYDQLAPAFGNTPDLAAYKWGQLHRIVFKHPLGGPFNIPGPNPYGFTDLAPDLPGLARSGAWEAVDVGNTNLRATTANGFMFGSGAARRFVGEMSPTIRAFEILPGGESGVLGSPYYANQLGRWLTHDYHALPIPAAAAVAQAQTTLSFSPR